MESIHNIACLLWRSDHLKGVSTMGTLQIVEKSKVHHLDSGFMDSLGSYFNWGGRHACGARIA